MHKRLVLVYEDSLCPRKQPDVSGPGLGEAGHYRFAKISILGSTSHLIILLFEIVPVDMKYVINK